MAFGDGDLDVFLGDMGSKISWTPSGGGQPVTIAGLFTQPDVLVPENIGVQVLQHERVLLVKTAAIAGLAIDQPVTVDGVPHVVRSYERWKDGAYTHLRVAPTT